MVVAVVVVTVLLTFESGVELAPVVTARDVGDVDISCDHAENMILTIQFLEWM